MGIYAQDNTRFIERDLVGVAKRWNELESSKIMVNAAGRKKMKGTVFTVKQPGPARDGGLFERDGFQTRLK